MIDTELTGTNKMQELRELKTKRASIKRQLTNFNTYMAGFRNIKEVSKQQVCEVKCRLKKIQNLFDEYDSIQTAIEIKDGLVIDDDDIESSSGLFLERDKTESFFYQVISSAQELIESNDLPGTSEDGRSERGQNNSSHTINNSCNIKLPTVKLPSFNGDYNHWLEFHDSYNSLIHGNESLSDVTKFQYLKGSLVGNAASVIQSLEISAANYIVAWQLLCERYNNKRQLIHNHLKLLLDIPVISKESDKSLRYIIDHISKHIRALNGLGESTSNWDTLIIFLFTSKLDSQSNTKWEEFRNSLESSPRLDDFYNFLRQRANILEMTSTDFSNNIEVKQPYSQQYNKRLDKPQRAFVAAACDNKDNMYKRKCPVCSGDHLIYYCEIFSKMSIDERNKKISQLRICINCLKGGHFSHQCTARPCNICKRKHNTLLHRSFDTVKNVERKPVKTNPVSLSTCISNQVLLSTALIKVKNIVSGKLVEARCLLDCGSQSSFITQDLQNKLGIKGNLVNSVSVTGINNLTFNVLRRCTVSIQPNISDNDQIVDVFIIPQITSNLPTAEVDITELNLPQNVVLADPTYHRPSKIDVLLGADVFWNVMSPEKIHIGKNKPVLQNSVFGWLVVGPVMCLENSYKTKDIVCNFSQEIRQQLKKFWELEEVPESKTLSPEEEACEQHFVRHTRRLSDGRFCVTLPLRADPEVLGNSYYMAKKRFDSLEKRFMRQPDVKEHYVEFIKEYEDLRHLSEVERPEHANYLPHHPVIKELSESTKCRVVFDASAKTSSGHSLNDIMMVGPTVQDDIFSILIRFRQHKYICSGDIEKMYRQIMVNESQRHLQTILWRDEVEDPMRYFQLNTVTYGTSCAPFLSTRCLVQLSDECNDPVISEIIRHDFYVDDLITGHSEEKQLICIHKCVAEILEKAGFYLRKIKSNSKALLNNVTGTESGQQNHLKISSSANTLGIEWNPNDDCILMSKIKFNFNTVKHTKRTILSTASSIFDPLGLLSLCVITCKMILQSLWLQNIDWDDKIPSDIHEKWEKFIKQFHHLENIAIPRHVMCNNPVKVELHVFSDASLKAYAGCVYMRSIDTLGNCKVSLLCAKSRVAPLKATTIPRLELCGAVLASRLCDKAVKSLRCKINCITYWCDSKIVLGWLSTPTYKLNTFVSHRVVTVNDLCNNSAWMYVPSSLNPADLASRGVYPEEAHSLVLWWQGPAFLTCGKDEWPNQGDETQTDLPELRVHVVHVDEQTNKIISFSKYSNYNILRRVIAYVLRFINNCKSRDVKNVNCLSAEELEEAELKLVYLAQQEMFPGFKENSKMSTSLLSLTPQIDKHNLIRVGGRLDNSSYAYEKKHPVILDAKHYYCKLLFEYFHVKNMHAAPQLLLSVIREQYWPIGGRILARKVYSNCIICKKLKGTIAKQIMGNLPVQRLTPGFPFEVTGVDYAGPFNILNKRGRGARLGKCYLCVFICFKVKAVHLELVSDMTTEAFILALRRFISRRGKPHEIFCDNGTNFVGASRELGNRFHNDVENSVSDLANEGIRFRFSPAYSPHFGGLYEAAVKSAKFHMKRVVGNLHLTFEELATLFTQIEAILNSRPLSPLSSNPHDLTPLTPGHFLIGRPLVSLPGPGLENANPNRLHRYAQLEQARQVFWSRWSREYICELQQRTKWKTRLANIKSGQMVLVKENNNTPLKWPLGRVIAVHPGSDGACRVADVHTAKGVLRRAADRLCPLLSEASEDPTPAGPPGCLRQTPPGPHARGS